MIIPGPDDVGMRRARPAGPGGSTAPGSISSEHNGPLARQSTRPVRPTIGFLQLTSHSLDNKPCVGTRALRHTEAQPKASGSCLGLILVSSLEEGSKWPMGIRHLSERLILSFFVCKMGQD